MKFRTLCFAPNRITPGMTLAKAVSERDGHTTLLTEGTVLDEEMLARLIHRGVETISVLVPDHRSEEEIAEEQRLALARVDAIFREDGNPARAALRAAITRYRLESTQ